MSNAPLRFDTNVMRWPSGDQAGLESSTLASVWVRRRKSVPSGLTVQISSLPK
jgi:hypothetical protein